MTAALAPVIGRIGEEAELEPPYSSMDMVALTGASYRQIDFWCRTKRLRDTASGSGMGAREFTADDLMTVCLVVPLLDHFKVDQALAIARTLLDVGEWRSALGNGYELCVGPVAS